MFFILCFAVHVLYQNSLLTDKPTNEQTNRLRSAIVVAKNIKKTILHLFEKRISQLDCIKKTSIVLHTSKLFKINYFLYFVFENPFNAKYVFCILPLK